jgi:hypothetical protein
MSENASPLGPNPTPPPARRLNRLALGLGLSLGALLFVAGALVLTSQKTSSPDGPATGPKVERSAEAGFLNQPPRQRTEADSIEENARMAALLRRAQPSPSGPFSLGPTTLTPAPDHTSLEPGDISPGGEDGTPPSGVYRPFPSYSRVTVNPPLTEPAIKPSWQAAFASSLVPPSGGVSPTVLSSAPPEPS